MRMLVPSLIYRLLAQFEVVLLKTKSHRVGDLVFYSSISLPLKEVRGAKSLAEFL